ncbi:hypothetical protein HanHA300_Chr11g0407511 [Helianthus annuus]|nr:hypothetical protein HanHA300_Chr11g0407511 [Helianthus annuus]KAJ0517924.1 hypothetical protein HanHA89_Chr11g0431241 [Helianthus annuus]KAJ0685942.1 hypothetical protein HanLR1_Chr11g0408761 [Helianthus annuus]
MGIKLKQGAGDLLFKLPLLRKEPHFALMAKLCRFNRVHGFRVWLFSGVFPENHTVGYHLTVIVSSQEQNSLA